MDGSISELAANTSAAAVGQLLNAGALRLYDDADVLLAELRFADRAFGSPSDGSMKANKIEPDHSAKADGLVSWFGAFSANGTMVLNGSVGTGAGSALRMNSVDIRKGAEVIIDEFIYTARKSD